MVVVVDQPITDPISGSSLDFLETCLGVNQDVREDPELDNIIHVILLKNVLRQNICH